MALTPAQLEAYWKKNPQALAQAVQQNPAAFANQGTGGKLTVEEIVHQLRTDPNAGKRLWNNNLQEVRQAYKENPEAFDGLEHPNTMTLLWGEPQKSGFVTNWQNPNHKATGNYTAGGVQMGMGEDGRQKGIGTTSTAGGLPNQGTPSGQGYGGASGSAGGGSGLTSAQLEKYWQENPGALAEAVRKNPAAFTQYGTGTGLLGSERAMIGGIGSALSSLEQGTALARGDVNAGFDAASGRLEPYAQEGLQSSQIQAALSGALGPEAQQEAYNNFQESPGQAWLREQTERGVTRNAAATGGLRGGNVLKRLQENAAGLAAQDFDNSFNRLGAVANRGFQASGSMANIDAQRGGALADLAHRSGVARADMQYGLGNVLGGQRYDAGQRLAGNVGSTVQGLAGLQGGLGQQGAQIIGQDSGNLANLLAGIGDSQNSSASNLATLLANLSQNQGSAVAGQPAVGGLVQPDNSWATGLSGLGNILAAYGQMRK